MRVLLVEDDLRFGRVLAAGLRRAGYDVVHATTAAAALATTRYDLMLLDVGLPDGDGIDLCRRIRATGEVGIIMLTARGQEADRIAGLRNGADDYVVKPFAFAELQARMEAVLRRLRPRVLGTRTVGRLTVNLDAHAAYAGPTPIPLTRKEFELLSVLVDQPGTAVQRERLLAEVWPAIWRGNSRTLDVHVASLRTKIGTAAEIQTIRGVGYRVVPGPS